MALIKADDPRLAAGMVVLDLSQLDRQSQHILDKAREQAAEISRVAHAEGLAAGRQQAAQQAAAAFDRLQTSWAQALARWEAQRESMIAEARQSVVELAVALAEKIVRRVPRIDPTIIIDQVTSALRHVTHAHEATVRVHPADRFYIEQCLPRLTSALENGRHISIVDDSSVEPGGCTVTAGHARIDATLDKQWERMVELLLPDSRADLEAA